ncbi:MAG TPA: LamG domain-containing protein, partial [Gemmatimonadaceae bacterium]
TPPGGGHDASPPDDSGTDAEGDVVSGPPYVLAVLADQPVAYWRFGESSGTRAADASGHGNDATYVGGVTLGAPGAIFGDPDTAASFDGSSGFVDAANRFVFGGDQAFSLEAWVNAASVGGYLGIVSRNDAAMGPPSEGYLLFVGPSDGPIGFQRIDGSNLTTVSSTATPTAGSYVHVVAVFDGVDMYVYVDGELQGTQTGNFNLGGAMSDFVVAAEAGGTGNFFSGAIDEVAVYDKPLTADRIKAHWVIGHG